MAAPPSAQAAHKRRLPLKFRLFLKLATVYKKIMATFQEIREGIARKLKALSLQYCKVDTARPSDDIINMLAIPPLNLSLICALFSFLLCTASD
jgi:hypothetical protein